MAPCSMHVLDIFTSSRKVSIASPRSLLTADRDPDHRETYRGPGGNRIVGMTPSSKVAPSCIASDFDQPPYLVADPNSKSSGAGRAGAAHT